MDIPGLPFGDRQSGSPAIRAAPPLAPLLLRRVAPVGTPLRAASTATACLLPVQMHPRRSSSTAPRSPDRRRPWARQLDEYAGSNLDELLEMLRVPENPDGIDARDHAEPPLTS
uniref:Uncharacterized protein n=1 Tax=Oryza glaberrima TaxID=4538 RepID=I1P0A5_ORYGL